MGRDVREQRHRIGGREGKGKGKAREEEGREGDWRLIRPGSGISEAAAGIAGEGQRI